MTQHGYVAHRLCNTDTTMMCGWQRTSKGAQSAALTPTTSAELAHRELRRLKLMPFTHSSPSSTLVGTTCPPGHMQKEYTLRSPVPGARAGGSAAAAAPPAASTAADEPESGSPAAPRARRESGWLSAGSLDCTASAPEDGATAAWSVAWGATDGGRVGAVVAAAGVSHSYGWPAGADAASCTGYTTIMLACTPGLGHRARSD